ncbi:MAG: hypothetical protein IPH10_02765 [bacterium]|nr:hypothetical protein [bacterium]
MAYWRKLTWFALCLFVAGCRDKGDSCEDCSQLARPFLAVASAVGGELAFFNPITGVYLGGGELAGWATACELTQIGDRLIVTDNVVGAMSIYALPDVDRLEQLSIAGTPIDLRVSANSGSAHLITHNGRYYRVSLSTLDTDTNATGFDPRRLRLRPPTDFQTWIACRGDSTIRVVQAQGLQEIRRIELPAYCSDIEFSPDGARAYCALPERDELWVVDAETGAVVDTIAVVGAAIDLAMSLDGRYLMAADSGHGDVGVFDLVAGTTSAIRCGTRAIRPRYSHASEAFFVICPGQSYVLRVDPHTTPPTVTDTLQVEAIPQCMAILE